MLESERVTDEPDVLKFVFNVPGAIGYVRASDVDSTVKVLRVDGRLPGDKDYRFRLTARSASSRNPLSTSPNGRMKTIKEW
jgi:hypothetical protein